MTTEQRYEDMLELCLARMAQGATLDECLAEYPQARAALEGPLRVAAGLRALAHAPGLSPAARARIQTRMLERAARRSASAGRGWRDLDPLALLAGTLRSLGYGGPLSRPALGAAAAGIALVLALLLGTGVYAAARAIVHAVAPAQTAPTAAPASDFRLDGRIEQIAGNTWTVDGVAFDVDATTSVQGTPAPGALAHVQGAIRDDGTLLARSVVVETPAATAPTAAPTNVPTAAPAAAPPPAPTAPAADPLAELQRLLEAGRADGRAGQKSAEMLAKLAIVRQSIAKGDGKQASAKLADLRTLLVQGAADGSIDPAFASAAFDLVEQAARAYRLTLTVEAQPPKAQPQNDNQGDDKDNEKGKDKEKDKGKGKEKDKGKDKKDKKDD